MIRRSRSVTETATSVAQKNEATAASRVKPKTEEAGGDEQRPWRARRAGTSTGSASRTGGSAPAGARTRRAARCRTTRAVVSHAMQAEPGLHDRAPSGTRAATTLRKLPSASPGRNAIGCEAPRSIVRSGRLFRRAMLSVSTKRCAVFAGVLSSASETDSAALGGRASTRCRRACSADTGPAPRRCSR